MNSRLSTLIDSDPERMGGEVCFTGTRIPVRNLFDYLAAGQPLDEFLEDFPSAGKDRAAAVLRYATAVLEALAKRQAQHHETSALEHAGITVDALLAGLDETRDEVVREHDGEG